MADYTIISNNIIMIVQTYPKQYIESKHKIFDAAADFSSVPSGSVTSCFVVILHGGWSKMFAWSPFLLKGYRQRRT